MARTQTVNKYPFWHLQAAEVLTAVYYINEKQAAKHAVENKTQYEDEFKAGEEWVTGLTFKQWQREYGAPHKVGWWWYAELNDEEAPIGGPYATFEQACRAGVRKYGRGKQARYELTWCLLFDTEGLLRDVSNLGTNCYGKHKEKQYPRAKQLQAQWFELAVNGNWAELKQQWGFAPDKNIAKQVSATVAGRKMFSELLAKQTIRENKITNEQLKVAITKKGFKYRQYEGRWQYWWAASEWRNYAPGVTERSLLLREAKILKLFGLKDDLWLKHVVCEKTGASYGNF